MCAKRKEPIEIFDVSKVGVFCSLNKKEVTEILQWDFFWADSQWGDDATIIFDVVDIYCHFVAIFKMSYVINFHGGFTF